MKHIKILIILLLVIFTITSCQKTEPIAVIPEPSECIQKKGHFVIDERTFLCFGNIGEEGRDIMKNIRESYPKKFKGLKPNLGDEESAGKNSILFAINEKPDETLGDEGYTLTITPRKIVAKANTVAGLFYAYQTMVQMSYASQLAGDGKYTVPCAKIKDTPRFAYRGAHLDVSRHFFDVDYVKKYLDMMATYKLNKFHWHLTDDHGWRIQIDKYPALTTKGAWRPERSKWDTLHPMLPDEPACDPGIVPPLLHVNKTTTVELNRMGANISTTGARGAIIEGPAKLTGCEVSATDLRAGAAMILAGLVAEGQTTVGNLHHIDRGYEDIVGKLQGLGADIQRISVKD